MSGSGLLATATLAAVLATSPTPATAAPGDRSGSGGGVVVTPIDPHGRLDPPRVGLGVHRPGRPGSRAPAAGPASHPRRPPHPKCVYIWESGLEPSMRRVGFGGTPPAAARLYSITCGGVSAGFLWLTPAQAPAAADVDPRVLAMRAYRELGLAAPVIGTSPGMGVAQLVRVPTWLWVDRALWAPRSATAAVPGLSATVTATPTNVSWSVGDGSVVVCTGAGTPFTPGASNPYGPSPNCGHTYIQAQTVTVTATVSWHVSWVGGRARGTLPDLQSRSTARLRVIETRTVNR